MSTAVIRVRGVDLHPVGQPGAVTIVADDGWQYAVAGTAAGGLVWERVTNVQENIRDVLLTAAANDKHASLPPKLCRIVADLLAPLEREDQLRQLLSYCRAEQEENDIKAVHGEDWRHHVAEAYRDVVGKLTGILDGEQ